MGVTQKLSSAAPGLLDAALPSAQAGTIRRTYGSLRSIESLPADKARFETNQSVASELPERLAVFLSAALVGGYALAFLAQFVARYIGV